MKKLYILLFTILITSLSFGQIIITEVADPDNNDEARYIEIHNPTVSAVDLTGWELRRWTNENGTTSSTIDLTSIGSLGAGAFVVIAALSTSTTGFEGAFGFAPDIIGGTGGPADSNGDDQIAIFDDGDTIIDIFGVPGEDGSNTCHEFENGRAEREASVTTSKSTWDEADWNVWSDASTASGCTNHMSSAPQDAPLDFDPGAWIGESNYCPVFFDIATYNCNTNTVGDNNDSVTISIPYSNSEAGITSVSTTSGGTVGGDDPASIVDGIITITGLSEGSAWDITLNGGNCDGKTSSGIVPSAECDPPALVINELLADPAAGVPDGDANGDGFRDGNDDEFVEIYNISLVSIDMENYTLHDATSLRHTFPNGTILPANSFITVFGGGTPTGISGISQIASSGSVGLNNSGDTVTLKNAGGTTVVEYIYGSEGNNNQSIARDPDFTGSFVEHLSHSTNSVRFSPGEKNDGTLSANDFDTNNFKIHPNPTSLGYVNISSKNGETIKAIVFDILGKQVINSTVTNNKLDVSNLNTGVYIMRLTQNNATVTKKLVIN